MGKSDSEGGFEIPSWEQVYEWLLGLAESIRQDGFDPDVIIGVCRGGWPPARVMSDLLENPELANVATEFYVGVGETKKAPVITQSVSASVKSKKVLVVDDIADTGQSLKLIRSHLEKEGASEVKIATIYYKPWSILVPDYYQRETRSWVVFPWERKETVRRVTKKYERSGKTAEEAKKTLIRSGLDQELVERFAQEIFGDNS